MSNKSKHKYEPNYRWTWKHQHFILTLIFLITHLTIFGQTGVIQGHVYDRLEKRGLAYANVLLVNTNIGTATDFDGNFKIDSIPIGTYDLKINYIIYGDTILRGLTITSDTIITVNLKFPPPCKYDKVRKNNHCPICGKKDKVIPVVYGYPIGKLDKKHYYYAGCEITYCDPDWYCKRDKHLF